MDKAEKLSYHSFRSEFVCFVPRGAWTVYLLFVVTYVQVDYVQVDCSLYVVFICACFMCFAVIDNILILTNSSCVVLLLCFYLDTSSGGGGDFGISTGGLVITEGCRFQLFKRPVRENS